MNTHRVQFRLRSVVLLAALGMVVPATIEAKERYVSPAEARLRGDITFLAADAREGRGTGSEGIEEAAEHIATVFRELGLKPAPGAEGYFQPFELSPEVKLGEPLDLDFDGPGDQTIAAEKDDFTALTAGGGGEFHDVPLVFAGYGITAQDEDEMLDYDDYKGLDVKDKAVLIIRREPQQNLEDSPFAGAETSPYSALRHKLRNAERRGAKALLLVNDAPGIKEDENKDALLDPHYMGSDGKGIPFIMVKRAFANRLLAAAGMPNLDELEKEIDQDLMPRSRPLDDWSLDATITMSKTPVRAKNVIGVLEGAGPHADETIVIGAHYDHLGFGGQGSMAFGSKEIHNGADDNASGTAMVLELARRLAARHDPLPRRVVFMAFSAEERGLLGSKHYVDHPLFPLENTVFMLNFDMVGRLNDEDKLSIFGAGTSPGLDHLADALALSQGIDAKLIEGTQGVFFQSDHASFYRKDIPVLFAFTGTHDDYHRPSDDTERINFEGMTRIANFGELLLLDLARRPERPAFLKLQHSEEPSPGRLAGHGAYFGSRPSYGESDVKGVKLDGVTEGGPADKAGLKGGDIIIRFAGAPVETIEDFMMGLSEHKPGDAVEVVVLRDGEEKTLKATLGSRGQE